MANEHEIAARWQDDLLPHVVDRLARDRPDAIFGQWVSGTDVTSITYSALANIIDGLSTWLVDQLGAPGKYGLNPEVLTYIGPNDVRYAALLFAAIKTGYVLFVTSPRNSPEAHRSLFDHLQCQTLITSDPVPPAAQAVLDIVKPARHLKVPSVAELLAQKHTAYQLNKSFQELQHSPFVIMHTSGTTGLPKPIVWTHDTCNQVLNAKSQKAPEGTVSVDSTLINGKRVIITLPPFHGACLAQLVVGAIPFGNVVIAPVAAAFPTAQGVVDALKQTPADAAILVPSVIAELAHNPELLDYCAQHLETIIYIGGDLPKDIGDRVADKLYLRCQWGQTETGIVPQLLPAELVPPAPTAKELWRYVRFHPCVGAAFEQVTDGNYEFVVKRDKVLQHTQPCFTVPGLDNLETEFRTKDLFIPHPSIPNLWRWHARADDIIVFLNGEKTNPISMEQHIMASHPELSGALVIGAQRFQAALLIEPAKDNNLTTTEQAALIERVWPSVEEANITAPAHARVEKSFILVVPADRRLIRAGKGTFMRGASIKQYTEEIENLYSSEDVARTLPESSGGEAILYAPTLTEATRLIRQQVYAVLGSSTLGESDNFFDHGMDSLQGLQLTRSLRRTFRQQDIALSTIYQNPSITKLADSIVAQHSNDGSDRDTMDNLLATYSGLIDKIPTTISPDNRSRGAGPIDVLLTGSTGAVGTQLLHSLLNRDGVGRVFCLNRGDDGGKAAQYVNYNKNSLSASELESRVTFINADLQHPSLGLDKATSDYLRATVGIVIHAAWPVNFNMPLVAFRPQLAGLVNLMAWAASTTSSSKFVFISSIAAMEGYKSGPAPEGILQDLDTPAHFGYGMAKFLAELLVDKAAQHLGKIMPAYIARVGQVSGPVKRPGIWNPKEWLPSMVMSSLYLGQIPDTLGPRFDRVDFVPIDVLADILVDVAMASAEMTSDANVADAAAATVFNVRNPRLTPWTTLLPAIVSGFGDREPLQVVSPATWLEKLQKSSETGDDNTVAKKNPAVKLLDFFAKSWPADGDKTEPPAASPPPMAIERTLTVSPTLRALEPVSVEWVRKWLKEWIDFQGC
ncbi:putative secondary metabolism biosynthetic enzyme [Neopestalotiopsis sp. 37M]|nr:putative secondary metabolism biosynthetic enzyme [Neopestalotiopsis sp. 37M]